MLPGWFVRNAQPRKLTIYCDPRQIILKFDTTRPNAYNESALYFAYMLAVHPLRNVCFSAVQDVMPQSVRQMSFDASQMLTRYPWVSQHFDFASASILAIFVRCSFLNICQSRWNHFCANGIDGADAKNEERLIFWKVNPCLQTH